MNTDPLDVLSIDEADVYKGTQQAGTLVRWPDRIEFSYTNDYVKQGGAPLSGSLPLSPEPTRTTGGAVPPFLAGLLPEGRRLSALRLAVKTSADDEFSLLLAVGGSPIGDVCILPSGSTPTNTPPLLDVRTPFDELHFSKILNQAGIVDPVALPGIQDKASLLGISLPIGQQGDQFILKLDPPEHPHIVRNEAYFLDLAKKSGIPTTDFTLVEDADGRPGLLVKRFDRVIADGITIRLECEDACQILGRWPADKYNVSSETAAHAIIRQCDAGIVAARDVLRQLVFAWLCGNGDVHAKNLSVLRSQDGERRLAPAYDLPSTVPYGDLTSALTVGGRGSGISRRRWIEFGTFVGVREAASTKLIDQLLEATSQLEDDLKAGALPFSQTTTRTVIRELRNRRRLLQR